MQRAIFAHLHLRGHKDLVAWHTPQGNLLGGRRSRSGMPIQGAINRALGVLPGVSDICIVHRGKFFALELKSRGRRPTEAQLEFMARINNAGGHATWTDDLDRALDILDAWGLFRTPRTKDEGRYVVGQSAA
jgi:hypothetical protein